VKSLLALKAEYKAATGSDWKPGVQPPTAAPAATAPAATQSAGGSAADINTKIGVQGDKIRQLKADKAAKVTQFNNHVYQGGC
jgi:bifunctional glutamyl/prolyl-tRNA synthetase